MSHSKSESVADHWVLFVMPETSILIGSFGLVPGAYTRGKTDDVVSGITQELKSIIRY